MDVIYACNDSYVYQTIISMVSLIKTNKEVCIYLISDKIAPNNLSMMEHILKRYNQPLNVIEADVLFQEVSLEQEGRHPRTIYAKLFMERVINSNRLLYLDSDTIVCGSLQELFLRNMDDEVVAGVLMPYSVKKKLSAGITCESPYICDGVVLFNMKRWKTLNKKEDCMNYIDKFKGSPPMQSEGTLNYVCQNQIGVLAPQFNVMPSMLMYTASQLKKIFHASVYYQEIELEKVKNDYRIIHFMNELYNRPWYEPCRHPLKMKYLEIEQELFGGNTIHKRSLSIHTAITAWLASHLPFSIFLKLYHIKNGI